jgi:hypothetical protein
VMGLQKCRSIFLGLITRWQRVVNFQPLLHYPKRKGPPHPLDRSLGDPQSRSGCCVENWNLCLQGMEAGASRPKDEYPASMSYSCQILNSQMLYYLNI